MAEKQWAMAMLLWQSIVPFGRGLESPDNDYLFKLTFKWKGILYNLQRPMNEKNLCKVGSWDKRLNTFRKRIFYRYTTLIPTIFSSICYPRWIFYYYFEPRPKSRYNVSFCLGWSHLPLSRQKCIRIIGNQVDNEWHSIPTATPHILIHTCSAQLLSKLVMHSAMVGSGQKTSDRLNLTIIQNFMCF